MTTDQEMEKKLELIGKLQTCSQQADQQIIESTLERIRHKWARFQQYQLKEFSFRFEDIWQKQLFTAYLTHCEIPFYRRKNQRRTTVMAEISPHFLDGVLWPKFLIRSKTLKSELSKTTSTLIENSLGSLYG